MDNQAYRGVIFRRTFPRLGEIIDRSHKYYRKLGGVYSGSDSTLKLPAWTFRSGAKVAFSHCQNEEDKYNHQGREWHFIGFDQLEEFTETQYLYLIAQNRTSEKSIRCYIRSTANPGGVGHSWVKRRFIDCLKPYEIKRFKRVNDEDIECDESDPVGISRSFVPATVYDNPSLTTNDPGYVSRLEQLPEIDKQALLYGNWEIFKGQFFKMWRNSIHVKDKAVLPGHFKFLALDYGYSKPSAVGWWAVDFDGNLHQYRELYVEGLTYEKLAHRIIEETPSDERMEYCVADPAIWGDRKHHSDGVKGESGAETMQAVFKDFTTLVKADNSRVTGWGRMRIMMEPKKDQFGMMSSRMTWAPECKHSVRTIPAMIHDDRIPEDMDSDGEDHAADESRYAVMSRPVTAERVREKATGMTDTNMERMEQQQALYDEVA